MSTFIRYSYPDNSGRLELLLRSWMHRENAALRPEARSDDSRNVSDRLCNFERATPWRWVAQIFFRTTPCNDLSVFTQRPPTRIGFMLLPDTKIKRDKWVAGPVEQSRGKAVMLGDRQKFPVILRSNLNTIWCLEAKEFKHQTFIHVFLGRVRWGKKTPYFGLQYKRRCTMTSVENGGQFVIFEL